MSTRLSRLLRTTGVACLLLGMGSATHSAQTTKPTLFLVGDSTVKNGTRGQKGWGEMMESRFNTNRIRIANHAIGGRSSRTFFTEERWSKVAAELRPGDFVIMQFGHNDGGAPDDKQRPRGSLRGTGPETRKIVHPQTGKTEVIHTYGWYLRQFVSETKARGATPIVCSLVPRNIWKAGKVERASGSFAGWAAEVARSEHASFLDLNNLIADQYQELGEEKTRALFFGDHTHTSPEGARFNAAVVVAGLKALPGRPLADFLADDTPANRAESPDSN